jgi:hypothetical protein
MRKIKAWLILPGAEPKEISVDLHESILGTISKRYFDDMTLDLPKVRFRNRLCHMAVDDEGLIKGLPRNEEATKAYLANCHPGTEGAWIAGPAVIFDGLLP